jgi:hypothetical protein
MTPQMSVLGLDIAAWVFHVVGRMTPGRWYSGSTSPGVHGDSPRGVTSSGYRHSLRGVGRHRHGVRPAPGSAAGWR